MKLSRVVLVALVSLGISACTKKEDKKFANYVREALKTNIKGLDPVVSGDLYSSTVMAQIFGTLTQYSYLERPTKVVPYQADGMPQISKDGLTYTFKIKKGVLFHDDACFSNGKGRELEAEDFIYSFKRLADPAWQSDGFWIFEDKIKGFTAWRNEASKAGKADYSKPVPGLEAVDKHTLKISLEKPYPQLLYVLTMSPAMVVPRECVEKYGKDFQNHPVGTGPYKFQSWTRNSQIVLERHPGYMEEYYPTVGEPQDQANGLLADAGKRLPLNDGVIFTEIVEDQPRWLSFRKGEFDYLEIPKDYFDGAVVSDDLTAEYKNAGVSLSKTVGTDITFVSFNMDDPVVGGLGGKGKYLRQALSTAYNTEETIKKFYNGRAVSAQGPIPPGLGGYDPNRVNPFKQHNIEKAKELLKKAGYTEATAPEIHIDLPNGVTYRQFGEYYQQLFNTIGVKAKVQLHTWPEFQDKHKKRKSQVFSMAWGADYPDAENFLQLFYGKNASPGPNNSNFNHPEFNKLFEKAAVMQDGPARNAIYNKMVDIVIDETPWIFGVHRKDYYLTHGWFKNYKRNGIILNYSKYYRVDQEAKDKLKKKL
ncbi:MAG: hypothetical protein IT289_02640 [Oligoflexia bacterium]|nr:hypothetical protein [Oligoflexia bacterium]